MTRGQLGAALDGLAENPALPLAFPPAELGRACSTTRSLGPTSCGT